jgi:hypothetical protein
MDSQIFEELIKIGVMLADHPGGIAGFLRFKRTI